MRKPMAKKVLAATLAAAMTMSAAACGEAAPEAPAPAPEETPASTEEVEAPAEEEEEEEVTEYNVIKDADGNVIDLGGAEIHLIDWWSQDTAADPETPYDQAVYDYRQWIQETYNFTFVEDGSGDWGGSPQQFVDYVTGGDDGRYLMWQIPSGNSATILSAAQNGQCYNIQNIDCVDLSDPLYAGNACHELYTMGDLTFGYRAGVAEPRTGVYFNKKVLNEIGINPDDIYDMQANDTWTWEAFEALLEQATVDTNNDGEIDIWGLCCNESPAIDAALYSNNAKYIGRDADGNFTYEMETPEAIQAFEWIHDVFTKYDWEGPASDDPNRWEFYKDQFKSGGAAFLIDQEYCAAPGNLFADMDELGFVCFPKGPSGQLIQCADDNFTVIPGCYDDEKAWACAFAYGLWNAPVPGYENMNGYIATARKGNFDERALTETLPYMCTHATISLVGSVPNNNMFMNDTLRYKMGPEGTQTISEILEANREIAKQYIADANAAR